MYDAILNFKKPNYIDSCSRSSLDSLTRTPILSNSSNDWLRLVQRIPDQRLSTNHFSNLENTIRFDSI